MVDSLKTLHSLKRSKILVIGDLMLDAYSIGKGERISPEAPVPVVLVGEEEEKAGGAGNVVLNLLSLGAEVTVMGRVGDDRAGSSICKILEESGSEVEHIAVDEDWITPLKRRVIANGQQVVRLDYEKVEPLGARLERLFLTSLEKVIDQIDLIAISDYGKGLCTPTFLEGVISLAKKRKLPVVVDPKGMEFTKYRGATLVKPNEKEALLASGLEGSPPLEEIATTILLSTEVEQLVITRSSEGISLFDRDGRKDFPALVREVSDVTGAGDTVLAALSVAIASGVEISEAVALANVAAGLSVEQVGCASVSPYAIACRLMEDKMDRRIVSADEFKAMNIFFDRDSYLTVKSRDGIAIEMIVEINNRSNSGEEVVIVVEDDNPDHAMVQVLSSMRGVKMVVLGSLEEQKVLL